MIRKALLLLTLLVSFTPVALAQYETKTKSPAAGGLPPFLAAMKRHDLTIRVGIEDSTGKVEQASKGLPVGLRIIAGGAKVRDYTGRTDASGVAILKGVPSNPEVQRSISYEAWVDYKGVRFPFKLDGVPSNGASVDLNVYPVTQALAGISAQHSIELFADEESLVARHVIRLYNEGNQTVDLGSLAGGGLAIPCPIGAKHPELHDEHDPLVEVRGTSLIYKGALLPAAQGPAIVNFVYTIPYKESVFEWNQNLPIRTRGVTVAVPQHKQRSQREAVIMSIQSRAGFGAMDVVEQGKGKSFSVLRSNGAVLDAGQPLRFAISGLPSADNLPNILLVVSVVVVFLIVIFGYRRREGDRGVQLSLTHLEAERDRLVKALARIRKAHEKGRLPTRRFEREQEAITARLVSLYRAIDALETA